MKRLLRLLHALLRVLTGSERAYRILSRWFGEEHAAAAAAEKPRRHRHHR